MKFYSLFFIILFIPELGYSQDSIFSGKSQNYHSGFSVSLEAGVSSRFGLYSWDYAEDDGWQGGECASLGSAISMNCDYRFKNHNLELTAKLGYDHNNYDMSSFINEEYNAEGPGHLPSKLVTKASATGYSTSYFSVGAKRHFGKKKLTFYIDLMAGLLICQTPAISFTERYSRGMSSDTLPWKVTQLSEIGLAYTIDMGAGIEYHIKKNVFMVVSGNIGVALNTINVTINSTYPSTIASYINSNNLPPVNYYSNLRIQINNLEMGIGYEF